MTIEYLEKWRDDYSHQAYQEINKYIKDNDIPVMYQCGCSHHSRKKYLSDFFNWVDDIYYKNK